MNRLLLLILYASAMLIAGCKGVGFRESDDARQHPSTEVAHEVLQQIQDALRAFHDSQHRYPATNEAHLYDSIRNYMKDQIDPEKLYRNDGGKGFYIAVGGRNNRIVYRFPPTVGPADYTLYWVGPNGVDELGEGDDLPSWDTAGAGSQFEKRKSVDLRGDNHPLDIEVAETGTNLFKDSVLLLIQSGDTVLYRDRWPLTAYFIKRPELTEVERGRIVREEVERLLKPSEFVPTDSLLDHDWQKWADLDPKSFEASEIVKSRRPMFNYYTGTNGSLGIVWSTARKKFIVVWRSA
jgi:hypothetical protein